jgi:hypothetical protein
MHGPGNGSLSSMKAELQERLQTARQLVKRLERLSVDSLWARRASGLRGALLRNLEALEAQAELVEPDPQELARLLPALEHDMQWGYAVLYRAAHAIRTPDTKFD